MIEDSTIECESYSIKDDLKMTAKKFNQIQTIAHEGILGHFEMQCSPRACSRIGQQAAWLHSRIFKLTHYQVSND
jgi:hypothetical protein